MVEELSLTRRALRFLKIISFFHELSYESFSVPELSLTVKTSMFWLRRIHGSVPIFTGGYALGARYCRHVWYMVLTALRLLRPTVDTFVHGIESNRCSTKGMSTFFQALLDDPATGNGDLKPRQHGYAS